VQFCRAFAAQPDNNSGRIDPVKRGNFGCDPQRVIALQALQGLDDEYAVINFALSPVVTMYAFSLK